MNVCVIGAGYVGLVTGVCLSKIGHKVTCIDISREKIDSLNQGIVPIYEPGLDGLIKENVRNQHLKFSTNLADAVKYSEFLFIAVGTPPGEDGSADLSHVLNVASAIGSHIESYKIIVTKSTVPVGTSDLVRQAVNTALEARGISSEQVSFDVVSNPEFLREGEAITDFMQPDRIVVGVNSSRAKELMAKLYSPLTDSGYPLIFTDIPSAELIKYASNAMLATRISFMNELSLLCDRVGADIEAVKAGVGSDSRIGSPFLNAGLGYGGSCFPKDVTALSRTMKQNGLKPLLVDAVEEINARQRVEFLSRVVRFFEDDLKGKTIALWGLAFKPKTDDIREAPSLYLIEALVDKGAICAVYDPEAAQNVKSKLKNLKNIIYCNDMYDTLNNADTLLVVTEWAQFKEPQFDKMKSLMRKPVIFDGRNIYDPLKMKSQGWIYNCLGRNLVKA